MTRTKRKYVVRRLVASAALGLLLAVGLARAFTGGVAPAPDQASALVPASALVYLNLGTDRSAGQSRRVSDVLRKLPVAGQLRDALLVTVTSRPLGRLSLDRDVRPWLGSEAAYAQLPGRDQSLLVLRVRSVKAAEATIDRASGSAAPQLYRGTLLRPVGDGSVAALSGGWALIGAPGAVRTSLDTRAAPGRALGADKTYHELMRGLPRQRLANGWMSGAWLNAHLGGASALLAGAARAPAIQSAVVGFGDDGKRIRLAFRGRSAPGSAAGSGCTGATGQSDGLLSRAPAHPALFVGLAGAECVLRKLIGSPGSAASHALQAFSARAQKAGVNVDRDLLPLFGGASALSVVPGPRISLDLGDVPAQQGLNVLGRLQPALIGMLDPEAGGSTPGFAAQTVNGITALTADLTPGLQLSYAAFDGDLVLSTALQGIADTSRGEHLDQAKDFKLVLGDRPKSPSALVFVDLQKLLALADQAGLGSNPTYAALRDDLRKIQAAGAVLSREGNDIDAELRLKNP